MTSQLRAASLAGEGAQNAQMIHTAIRKIADIERREPQLYKEQFNQLSVDERCLILKGKKELLAYELYFNRVLLGGGRL